MGTHSQCNPRSVLYPDICMYFGANTPELSYEGAMPPIWSRSGSPEPPQRPQNVKGSKIKGSCIVHTHPTQSRCIESSPEDLTEDQPIAKELCVLMACESTIPIIWCVCVCADLWAAHSSAVAVCVYTSRSVSGPCGCGPRWVDDQRAAYRCHLHLVHIVSTPPNTPPAAPAAQITSLVATVPRETTVRSGNK